MEAAGRRIRASHVVGTVAVVVVVTALTALGLHLHADAARSARTQHHGAARAGVVRSVRTVHHDTSHDSWITYDYTVRLAAPVDDVSETVAHDPTKDFQRYDAGQQVDVLVDPQDTGYAELPGRPVQSSTWYLAPLVLGLVFLALVVFVAVHGRNLRRRRASPEEAVRSLFAAGRLSEAAALVDRLDPFAASDADVDLSLGAAVLDAYGDQVAPTDPDAAAAYRRAAVLQRGFASTATAGGEGLARMDIAARMEAKCRP